MTLEAFDTSLELAQPVYLYQFTLHEQSWRFTSSAREVLTPDGKLWSPTAMSHDGVKQSGNTTSDVLGITCPSDIAPVQLYMIAPPSGSVLVTIFQKDAQDDEYVAIYMGEVSQVNCPNPGKATISCETLTSTLRRNGLRLSWQRSCPYSLYDPATCKVPKVAYATPAVIEAINGFYIDLTLAGSLEPGIYVGGFFEWEHPVKGLEFRGIEQQLGNQLKVFGSTLDLYVGMSITLYRGCNRSPTACASFNNFDNYGGVPGMPGTSPFDGNPVFY